MSNITALEERVKFLEKVLADQKTTVEILKTSQDRLQQITEHANEIFYIHNSKHQLTYVSPACFEIMGYTPDEMMVKWTTLTTDHSMNKKGFKATQKALKTGRRQKPYMLEVCCKDGEKRIVEVDESPIKDEEGQVAGMIGAIRDVTAHLYAIEALQESQERFQILFDDAPDAMYVNDLKGRFIDGNKAAEKLVGMKRDELIGKNFQKAGLLAPDQIKKALGIFARQIQGHITGPDELKLIIKNGKPQYVEITGHPIKLRGKNVVLSTARDITVKREAELAVQSEHTRAQQYFNLAGVMFVVINRDQTVAMINEKGCEILGCSEKEILGQNWFDTFIPEINRKEVKSVFDKIMHGKVKPVEYHENPVLTRHGDERLIAWHNTLIKDVDGKTVSSLSSGEDITLRKQNEKWLIGLNDLKEDLLGANILNVKMQMVVEHIVKAFHADFARIWLIQPGDRCSLDCIHAQYKSGPHVCRHKELCLHLSASAGRYTHLDGKVHQRVPFGCYKIGRVASGKDEKFITDTVTKDLRVHDQKWAKELDLIGFAGYKLHSKDNQPLGVMALFTQHVISPEEDQFFETIAKTVAEVVQISYAEEALRASEERFRALVESTSDWIWEVNAKGVLTYCSPNVKELIGYNAEEMVGRRPFSIMAPDEAERNLKIFQRHVKEKSPIHNLESHSIHKRGHQVILETSGMPILDSKGNILGYRGIDRDITNRRHADETIRKSLEEKEILLKEIHHRVKNNLQIIISLLNLQSYRIEDKAAKQAFENSRQRVYSMALVHEKLYRSNNFANIQFNDYVKTMTTEIVRASVDISKVRLEIKVEAVELSIDLAIPFGLIINELITNSIKYAFPDERKGKIQILFKSVKDQYELTVIDDGIGLPDDVYFQKKGSLGMQLIHILTEQIGGSIEISREGGTRFTIQIDKPINRK